MTQNAQTGYPPHADPSRLLVITLKPGEQAAIYYRLSPTSRQNGLVLYGPDSPDSQWLAIHRGEWQAATGEKTLQNTSGSAQSWYLADWEVWQGDPSQPGGLGHQAYFWGDAASAGAFISSGDFNWGSGVSNGCSDVLALVRVQKTGPRIA